MTKIYTVGDLWESLLHSWTFTYKLLLSGSNNWVFLTPVRYQVTTPKIFTHAGAALDKLDIIVSKTRVHFRRGFMETGLMNRAIVIDTPGHGPVDIGQLDYENIPKSIYSRYFKERYQGW